VVPFGARADELQIQSPGWQAKLQVAEKSVFVPRNYYVGPLEDRAMILRPNMPPESEDN
jgi:hypothetical protein